MADITVAVPCYNHAKYIERCLRSIFAQSLKPKELIVIDDGSTDESARLIEASLRECPFPNRLIRQENSGQSAALNKAYGLSDSEYFAFLGADDIWLRDFLKERLRMLEQRPEAVVGYGNAYIIDEEDFIYDCTANWGEFPDGDVKPMLFQGQACFNPSVVYRSSALGDHKWNEECSVEDYEMYLKMSAEGPFAFDKSVLCAYRVHDSNMSHDYERQFRQVVESLKRSQALLDVSDSDLKRYIAKMKIASAFQFIRIGKGKSRSLICERIGETRNRSLRLAICCRV